MFYTKFFISYSYGNIKIMKTCNYGFLLMRICNLDFEENNKNHQPKYLLFLNNLNDLNELNFF